MFGKGIYFADVASKAAQYCHPTRAKPWGLLLLCEVALGKQHELHEATYMDRPPIPCHSTKGLGKIAPNEETISVIGGAEAAGGSGSAGAGAAVGVDSMEIEGEAGGAGGDADDAAAGGAGGGEAKIVFGPLVNQAELLGEEAAQQFKLQYNEHIVYDVGQVRIRYLVKCKFKFPEQ
jgi:hypothetical protein